MSRSSLLDWIQSNGLTPNHSKAKLLCPPELQLLGTWFVFIIVPHQPREHPVFKSILFWSHNLHLQIRESPTWLHLYPATSSPFKQHIYTSSILPKLDYCSTVWDRHVKKNVNALDQFAGRALQLDSRFSMSKNTENQCTSRLWQSQFI